MSDGSGAAVLPVYVFSYNRGRYLRNCLASVARHVPMAQVTVMDDGSDDPEVHAVLEEYRDTVSAVSSESASNAYLGGLYGNMQQAIERTQKEPLVLFLQDDMQVLRDLTVADLNHWRRYFERHPDSFQLYCCFVKRKQAASGNRLVNIDTDVPAYFRTAESGRRSRFSAVGLFHAARMKAAGWIFEPSEGDNNRKVKDIGYYMGMTPWPFMMWLPNAESAKFRRRGLLHRLAERRARVDFYPYRPMNPERVEWLHNRPIEELPVAEELLEPIGMDTSREWLFADATKAIKPLHRHLKRRKKKRVRQEQAARAKGSER